ncbi:hypothetical protein ACQP6C_04945 [Snodgrassella alvi]|uniref:hypothetical protein n=1 Tax=Snodgrassella alvi TaxID=1196083 RepID=UPI003D075D71
MAEWTGYWYGFYSNKPIDIVFSKWRKKMLAINYKYYYNGINKRNDNFETFFSYKTDEMYEYHLENGYNIDMQGEGCFMIQAKKAQLRGKATLFEFDDKSMCDPYDINLRFNSLYYYVLVLPEEPGNSSFSQKINNFFISILDEENDSVE